MKNSAHRHLTIAFIISISTTLIAGCGVDPPVEKQYPTIEVEIVDGPDERTGSTSADFRFACNRHGGCDYECSLDGDEPTSCDQAFSVNGLDDGRHTLEVVATDRGDDSQPAVHEWTVDTEPPELVITDGPPAVTSQPAASVEFACVDGSDCHFECALDHVDGDGDDARITGDWTECSSPWTVDDLAVGDYELFVTATDDVGNATGEHIGWRVVEPGWDQLSTGGFHTCAVRNDGRLYCWGRGADGQLGVGDDSTNFTPRRVGTDHDWTDVATGSLHTCGIRRDGTLWCWGRGDDGRLGSGNTDHQNRPTRVGTDDDWHQVTAGIAHTCATRDDGTLWCWGSNGDGQLGIDNVDDTDGPLEPKRVGTDDNWRHIDAGSYHTCGVDADGRLACWGRGSSGQLGIDGTDDQSTPHAVDADGDWSDVAASGFHTCGLRTDGTLWCWGSGTFGRLGIGDTDDVTAPRQVGADDDWRAVSTGNVHTCAVRTDESLWCWGRNIDGRLGIGDVDDVPEPRPVAGEHWEEVALFAGHSCGVQNGDELLCWGRNVDGQLGIGDTDRREEPAEIAGFD